MPTARIESLDQEGRGVAHPPDAAGKTIFVDGALIGEMVEYSSYRRKPTFEMADAKSTLDSRTAATRAIGASVMAHKAIQ